MTEKEIEQREKEMEKKLDEKFRNMQDAELEEIVKLLREYARKNKGDVSVLLLTSIKNDVANLTYGDFISVLSLATKAVVDTLKHVDDKEHRLQLLLQLNHLVMKEIE